MASGGAHGATGQGTDGPWVTAGIPGVFHMLDAKIGLGGRYDCIVGALVTAPALL